MAQSRPKGTLFVWIPVLMLLLVSLGAATYLALLQSKVLPSADSAQQPVTVLVNEYENNYSGQVDLQLVTGGSNELLATSGGGTVTAILKNSGDLANVGEVLYTVDNIGAVGYYSDTVFFRPLSRGDSGADVAGLQQLLTNMFGSNITDKSGRYGWSTFNAVTALSDKVGAGAKNGNFYPAWLVKLPSTSFTITSWTIAPGKSYPGQGEAIAQGLPSVSGLTIPNAPSGPDGSYNLRIQSADLNIERSEGNWTVPDLEQLNEILKASPSTDGQTTITGFLSYSEPKISLGVPNAAIITDDAGMCVLRREGNEYLPVMIDQVGSTNYGVVLVNSELAIGDSILINPLNIAADAKCSSN